MCSRFAARRVPRPSEIRLSSHHKASDYTGGHFCFCRLLVERYAVGGEQSDLEAVRGSLSSVAFS